MVVFASHCSSLLVTSPTTVRPIAAALLLPCCCLAFMRSDRALLAEPADPLEFRPLLPRRCGDAAMDAPAQTAQHPWYPL